MMLDRLFGSRVRANLLGWVFTHPGERFSVRQLAAAVGEDPTQVSRELSRLQELGIVVGQVEGRLKFFAQDPACAIRAELEGMFLKTVGAAGLIRAALEKIPGIEYAFLYGSFAMGTAGSQSDIDLMIVGALHLETLDAAMAEVERALSRSVNYVLYDRAEFDAKRSTGEGFLADVLKGPVVPLVGDVGGLAAIREYLAKQVEVERARAPGDVLLSLSGSWEDDRPAEEIAAEIRSSRRSSRRAHGF